MPAPKSSLTASNPVLPAADYERARAFYRDQLGYSVIEEGGDPPRFGIFRRDKSQLFVDSWKGSRNVVPELLSAYVHAANVIELAREFKDRGVQLSKPITETGYGMREFEVTHRDGNIICFGEDMDDL